MASYDSSQSTSKKRVNRIYSDLDLDFTRNPVTSDVVKLTDVEAVKRSVKNLIQTNHYERPFHPEIGSDVRALLPVAPCRTSGGVLQSPRNVGAKASTPSSGHGCHAASSATTRFASSFTPWPAIWATSCGRLRCRRRWKTGR